MAKKDTILKKSEPTEYELTDGEKQALGGLLNLAEQAKIAQDLIYTQLVQSIAARYEITNKDIEINMQEALDNGLDSARLIVK
jgi:hypothetical protein